MQSRRRGESFSALGKEVICQSILGLRHSNWLASSGFPVLRLEMRGWNRVNREVGSGPKPHGEAA